MNVRTYNMLVDQFLYFIYSYDDQRIFCFSVCRKPRVFFLTFVQNTTSTVMKNGKRSGMIFKGPLPLRYERLAKYYLKSLTDVCVFATTNNFNNKTKITFEVNINQSRFV